MPKKPMKPCGFSMCSQLVKSGERFCPKHKRAERKRYESTRKTAAERGYNAQWRKVRAMQLRHFPMCGCDECQGQRYAADMVHHIVPIDKNPSLRLAMSNLLSMANGCHERLHGSERWGGAK
jgi:5-methylcytosine-specific restriction enzyme A